MEWRSSLKHSQSLTALTGDKSVWTDGSLRDKKISVSQLVARYQVGVSQQIQTTRIDIEENSKEDFKQVWRPHLQKSDSVCSTDGSVTGSNDTGLQSKSPTSLSRSKSLGSLHNIDALKSKFEPRSVASVKQETFTSSPRKSANVDVSNGERRKITEYVRSISVEAPVKEIATVAKQTGSNAKVKNNTNIQRRKTIGGIDFETLAASQAEEKRRSVADFRDSSEKLSVSVKAISALYLSKLGPQGPKTLVSSSELGKRTRLTKMADDAEYKAAVESMQERRRKSEMKRLLKHCHPGITMLDRVVDKELASVFKSETEEAVAESGYEGEVFSKCLIFENPTSPNGSSNIANVAQGTDQIVTPSVFEEHETHKEQKKELIDEERIYVQSTRKIFEEPSMSYQHTFPANVYNADKATPEQILKKLMKNQEESQYKLGNLQSTDLSVPPEVRDEDFTSVPEPETFGDAFKTSLEFFRPNPFLTVNVEKEHSFQSTKENILEGNLPKVKTRKHLFESTPFDKIRQQNKDDMDMILENIKETLHLLYSANVLQTKGSIIKVQERMNATKVKFILTEKGPEIIRDTVAEGGAQNIILHLLPRANVEPHIKYLKEDGDGALNITEVNVCVHQNHSDINEFKTVNVVQLIEDILTQDNSLQKGVLIQDEVEQRAQVSVYSLYRYDNKEDLKSYSVVQKATAEDVEVAEQVAGKSETFPKEIAKLNSGVMKSAARGFNDKHRGDQTALETSAITSPLKTNDNLEKTAFVKEISTVQVHDSETIAEDEGVVFEGRFQAALQALERSNVNVNCGGFEAAMIHKKSIKNSSSVKETSCEKRTQQTGFFSESTQGPAEQKSGSAGQETASQNEPVMEKIRKPLGPKPALPPKPEHLKAKPKGPVANVQLQNAEKPQIQNASPGNNKEVVTEINDPKENQGTVQSQSRNTGKDFIDKQIENVIAEQTMEKEEPLESHVNFHEACQIFGGKKTAKTAPVKPKRGKMAHSKSREQSDSVTPTSRTNDGERGSEGEVKVTREKKGQKETEDERRQRLSVHMDEIVRGNTTAAMEIYDNLRKREELENILIRVEEIEDTSDAKSLKKVFQDVPDWVVSSDTKRSAIEGGQHKEKRPNVVKSNSGTMSPMTHVFGDLARASEEIIHVKEQTLARLLDIEESIKKALSSVSNLKSDSDIAGLSGLFKESLGAVPTPSSGNISSISIESSRTRTKDFQSNPMSSSAFISMSAVKTDSPPETAFCPSSQQYPKPDEFTTTKCHSPAPDEEMDPRHGGQKPCSPKPKREVSVLNVQT
ncbi:uncharacterized protein [Eucyclogobius newberryi]|uniref:uncharacterized protein n=1 Tax=Eucyclogobius newberryi TaxID=166745 RepID=UPI003B59C185